MLLITGKIGGNRGGRGFKEIHAREIKDFKRGNVSSHEGP